MKIAKLVAVVATLSFMMIMSPVAETRSLASNRYIQADLSESCDQKGKGADNKVDLMLLIDQSKSLEGNNLRALDEALRSLSPILESSDDRLRVGMATFSGDAQLVRSLSAGAIDREEFEGFRRSVTLADRLEGGTDYLAATDVVLNEFRSNSSPDRCKVLVWFTDGEIDLLGEQNRIREGDSLLVDFCGDSQSASSKARIFRDLGIRPFVVLLTPKPFETALPSLVGKSTNNADSDPYRKWASVVGLRGLTGDWDDPAAGTTKPGSECDQFSDNWGELIQVNGVSELAQQMLELLMKGTSVVPPKLCPNETQLDGLPAGILLERLIVSLRRASTDDGESEVDEPAELNKFVEGNLLYLSRSDEQQAKSLDALPAGWNLHFASSISSVCFGFQFRDAADLEFRAVPNQTSVHVPSRNGDDALNATIDLGGFDQAIDLSSLKPNDSSLSLVDGIVTLQPNATQKRLEIIPSAVRFTPRLLGPAGKVMIENASLVASLRLDPPVAIAGIEELPSVTCSEQNNAGDFVLEVKAIGEEVSKSPYRSKGECSLKAGRADLGGQVRIFLEDPTLSDNENGGFGILFNGGELRAGDGLVLPLSNPGTELEKTVFVGQTEPFPNERVDISRSSEMVIVWEDSDETIELGRVQVLVNLALERRSNTVLALAIALVASVLSAILAYILLYFVVRKSTVVGKPSNLAYLTADVVAVKSPAPMSGGVEWVDRQEFSPPAFEVTKVRALDQAGTKIVAGKIQFEARVGRFLQPADVVRGPWTTVTSLEPISLGVGISSEGRKPASALCPLGPVVIADVISRDDQTGRHSVRLTFVVPTRGKNPGYSGVLELAKTSALRAITKAIDRVSTSRGEGERSQFASGSPESNPKETDSHSSQSTRPVVEKRASTAEPNSDQGRSSPRSAPEDASPPRRPPGAHPL